jgi:CO/xanthine dehydrogenase Mo-binding subunit
VNAQQRQPLAARFGAADVSSSDGQHFLTTNPHEVPLRSRDGSPFFIAPHPVLALGKTRYVGEPVAVVIAETLWQAMDAAERLAVVVITTACTMD